MVNKLEEMSEKFTQEERIEAELNFRQMASELTLCEIRESLGLTQIELSELCHNRQAAISKMESRDDMLISSLHKVIRAMGGELELFATFPNGVVKIIQFTKVRE
ncbi:MAG: helix-turn-helix transcriptional regulator [Cardiobacteriaceae bacterium]|nr:helix-turn-helix transcriptional regulator [Cardiobacteriaceae bacterium]